MSSIDYAVVPLCGRSNNQQQSSFRKLHPKSQWQHAMQSLHGDMYYSLSNDAVREPLFELRVLEDLYCQHACYIDMRNDNDDNDDNDSTVDADSHSIKYIIQNSFRYNWYIDHLPAIFQIEDEYVSLMR